MAGSTITAGKKAGTPLPATYVTASGLPRYHPVSQALHWVTAALALAVLPLAWVAVSLPPAPAKGKTTVPRTNLRGNTTAPADTATQR